jgi:quinol monooxygenase YgiN
MLINAVTYTFAPEHADEAERLFLILREASLREAGCHGFEVARANDDRGVFVLYETWENRAALDAHYETEHFQTYGIGGIRKIVSDRVAHLCTPITP